MGTIAILPRSPLAGQFTVLYNFPASIGHRRNLRPVSSKGSTHSQCTKTSLLTNADKTFNGTIPNEERSTLGYAIMRDERINIRNGFEEYGAAAEQTVMDVADMRG